MLRPILALAAIALPAAAGAQSASPFCNGIAQLVVAATDRFEPLPPGARMIPGSIEERRGTTPTGESGPPRGAYIALLSRVPRDEGRAAFERAQHEVQRCLPGWQANVVSGTAGFIATWTLERATIRVVQAIDDTDPQRAAVALQVLERW